MPSLNHIYICAQILKQLQRFEQFESLPALSLDVGNRLTPDISVFPKDPVPAGSNVEIILSNVKNPSNGGVFYFNCRVLSPGDVPLLRDIGTWILTIS